MSFEFTPSKLRQFVIMTSALSTGALIVFLFYAWQYGELRWGNLLGQVIGFSIGVGLSIQLGLVNFSVSINGESITGPSKLGWSRVNISLTDIDWNQTRRLDWWYSPEGSWHVKSKIGEIILLSGTAFSSHQIKEMLEKLKSVSQSHNN